MTIEGIAAMVVFFGLLLLVVQIGFLVGSRMLTVSAVEAAARRLATSADATGERARLVDEIRRSVPGVAIVDAAAEVRPHQVEVAVSVDWTPPGPDLLPVQFEVRATRLRVVPP